MTKLKKEMKDSLFDTLNFPAIDAILRLRINAKNNVKQFVSDTMHSLENIIR